MPRNPAPETKAARTGVARKSTVRRANGASRAISKAAKVAKVAPLAAEETEHTFLYPVDKQRVLRITVAVALEGKRFRRGIINPGDRPKDN
ncbi:MAG TPA: hypothetical protein VM576_02230 [Xanthomonadaceae bacterium]|nr:hypothetical protein [Xanthomonadaceae bacterium]